MGRRNEVNLSVTTHQLPTLTNGVTCNISELLLGIYRRLENLPAIAWN